MDIWLGSHSTLPNVDYTQKPLPDSNNIKANNITT